MEGSDPEDASSEIDNTARALAAELKSVNSQKGNRNNYQCDFCQKEGHTKDKSWQNPENPDNKLTPKVQELLAAKEIKDEGSRSVQKKHSKKGKVEIAGAILEKTTISPPPEHRSRTMMVTSRMLMMMSLFKFRHQTTRTQVVIHL